jgi:hypothetical protein
MQLITTSGNEEWGHKFVGRSELTYKADDANSFNL